MAPRYRCRYMKRVRMGIAIAVVTVACACGSPGATSHLASTPSPTFSFQTPSPEVPSPTPSATPSPAVSPSRALASPSAQPSPTKVTLSCNSIPGAADEPLILNGRLIESFANPRHPVTMCSLSPNVSNVKFISRTEVGYAINTLPDSPSLGVTEFWRLNLVDRRPVRVANVKGSVLDFTWSPDG